MIVIRKLLYRWRNAEQVSALLDAAADERYYRGLMGRGLMA